MNTIKKESNKHSLVLKPLTLSIALLSASAVTVPAMAENTLAEAFSGGKPFVDLRLRYESADQTNATPSADALTLRTTFGYETGEYKGFSVLVEAEDVREVFGVNDFSVPPAGVRTGQFDIIADPETTELDQAFIQYKSAGFTTKLGRQVIALDGHRFIGTVGWRQDRQTFDGVTVNYKTDKLSLTGAYVTQRNLIFAEEADIDSGDVFLNASYKTSVGKFVAYSYLLDEDNGAEIDTYGISYSGSTKTGESTINYTAEYAIQDNDSNNSDTDYFNLGAGITFGVFKASLAYESLGSDSGGEFSTPLATLHKFNGWADVFILGTGSNVGLEDASVTLDADFAGGKFKIAYHDFSSDENTITGDDLGDEIDIQYTRNFGKHVYTGIKYANYSEGSATVNSALITDTERVWVWAGFKFK